MPFINPLKCPIQASKITNFLMRHKAAGNKFRLPNSQEIYQRRRKEKEAKGTTKCWFKYRNDEESPSVQTPSQKLHMFITQRERILSYFFLYPQNLRSV